MSIDNLLIDYDRSTKDKFLDFLKRIAFNAGVTELYNDGTEEELLFYFRLLNHEGQVYLIQDAKEYSGMAKFTKDK